MKKQSTKKIKEIASYKDDTCDTPGIRILLFLASLVFFGVAPLLNFKPAYDYTIIKDVLGSLFIAIFAGVLYARRKDISINLKGFIAGTVVFMYIIAGCFYAPVKYGAAQILENYLLYYLLFIVGMLWKWEKTDAFIWAASMVVASITAFVQYHTTRYPISTFGNPNFFAGHLLMPIFLSLYFIKKKHVSIAIIYGVITLSALFIVKSRAALFGFFVASAFASFLMLKEHRIRWVKYIGFAIVGIVGICMFGPIKTQLTQDIRYYIWRGTWNLIQHKPFLGWGTGNFIFYYPYFRYREYFLRPQATPITNHPHCQYLEILSENGFCGLMLFGALIVFALYCGLKKNSKDSDGIFLFASVGIIAVIVDNILSTNLTNTSTAMYFSFLVGLCFATDENGKKIVISRSWKTIMSLTMIFSMIALGSWKVYYRLIPEVYLKQAIGARERNDFVTAIENYEKVCKINPNHVVSWYKLAFAYGQIGDLENSERIYLLINNKLFPHFAKTDANLGVLYIQKQDYEKAKYYYEKALFFNPYDIEVLLSMLSIKLYHDRDIKAAREYLKRVMAINPEHEYVKYLIKNFPELMDNSIDNNKETGIGKKN